MSEKQIICGVSGESEYVNPRYLPDAGEYRISCPCNECNSVEYRETV